MTARTAQEHARVPHDVISGVLTEVNRTRNATRVEASYLNDR